MQSQIIFTLRYNLISVCTIGFKALSQKILPKNGQMNLFKFKDKYEKCSFSSFNLPRVMTSPKTELKTLNPYKIVEDNILNILMEKIMKFQVLFSLKKKKKKKKKMFKKVACYCCD